MDSVNASEKRPSVPGRSPITERLEELGAEIAKVSERAADPTTLPNARRRWLSAEVPARRPPGRAVPRWVPALVSSLSAALVAAVILVLVWRRDHAVSFTVGPQAVAGSVGQWVAPDGDATLDLRFSEGTLVTLTPGARLRVTETGAHGATLLIERGSLRAAITHRDADTRWSVQAGPFEVRVTGTSFDARWDPATETFELTMLEGSVVVSGPRLPSGRSVVAGEQLIVSATHMELRAGALAPPRPSAAPPVSCASPASPSPAPSAAPAPSASDSPAVAAAPSSSPDPDSWRALARAGKHKDAMNALEATGFSSVVARASSSELLTLADTARFAGRPARAKEALLAARKRFGARGSTAFLLGKISADQLGSPGEAVTWFETYLQEESGGPLAEQALGRVLEIRKKDPGAARVTAERYLARYPNGAYAALARSLVGPR